MAALPPKRVQRSRPFENSGLDYMGPFSVKSDNGVSKAYEGQQQIEAPETTKIQPDTEASHQEANTERPQREKRKPVRSQRLKMEGLDESLDYEYEFEEQPADIRPIQTPDSATTEIRENRQVMSITIDEDEARKKKNEELLQKARELQRQSTLLVAALEDLTVDQERPRTVITVHTPPETDPTNPNSDETSANSEPVDTLKRRASDVSVKSNMSKRSRRWDDDCSSFNSEFEEAYQQMLEEDRQQVPMRLDDRHLFGDIPPYSWDFNDGKNHLKMIPDEPFRQTVPQPGVRCGFCDSSYHYSNDCNVYPTLGSRRLVIVELMRCPACLGKHGGYCRKQLRCKICQSDRHHTSLCAHYGTRPFQG